MKVFLLIAFLSFSFLSHRQQNNCDHDSILLMTEDEKITFKQVMKLDYFSQNSKFAIRREYGEIDLVFSSYYGLEHKDFEGLADRDKLQSLFKPKDYIIRLQFKLTQGKLEEKAYKIGVTESDTLIGTLRLYHLDKLKRGALKIVSRKYPIKDGEIVIEKLTATKFCGLINLDIPKFYNLKSEFSVKAISK